RSYVGVMELEYSEGEVPLRLFQSCLCLRRRRALDRHLVELALGAHRRRARLGDALLGLIHGVDAGGELRRRLLDLSLGLGETPLGRLDGGARRLGDRLGRVEVAARDQLALEELPEALELTPRLTLRALSAG